MSGRRGIDLVVLCSHGRRGLARLALGSVAERLLHDGSAPQLLVRAFGPPLTLARAVVPLDESTLAEQALTVLAALAGSVVYEVTLLRVIAAPEERLAAEHYLAAVARRLPVPLIVRRLVEQGDPAERITAVAGVEALVLMATHGRSGLARLALGSVADRVAHGEVAGVLLVRACPAGTASVHQ
ncbi:MAG TPA: universal stress protein [Chloroflexota bacterium]|nr:universal stress protein [Chloroflexota bacterium]